MASGLSLKDGSKSLRSPAVDPYQIKRIAIQFKEEFMKKYTEILEIGTKDRMKKGELSEAGARVTGKLIAQSVSPIPIADFVVNEVINNGGAYIYGKLNQRDVETIAFATQTPDNPDQLQEMLLKAGAKFALAYEAVLLKMIASDGNRAAICRDAAYRVFSYILKKLKRGQDVDDHHQIELSDTVIFKGIVKGDSKQNAVSRITFERCKHGNPEVLMEDGRKLFVSEFLNAEPVSLISQCQDELLTRRPFEWENDDTANSAWWNEPSRVTLIHRISKNHESLVETKENVSKNTKGRTSFKVQKEFKPIWSGIGQVTGNFVGRSKEQEVIRRLFEGPEFLVRVTGMGGVGKSELVKKFAKQMHNDCQTNCIWINGDSSDSSNTSIKKVASELRIPIMSQNKPRECVDILVDVVKFLIGRIEKPSRILLIIDNVDETNETVKLLFSETVKNHCFVIVTSRNVGVLNFARQTVKLDVLDDEDAMLLVQTSLENEATEDVQSLCNFLQNLPLTLQQALGFIKMQKETGVKGQSYKIQDYLKDYQNQKAKLLQFPLNQIDHDYRETTLVTWNVSIEKIRIVGVSGRLAIKLLDMMAYFGPDGIHVDFLERIYKGKHNASRTETEIDAALGLIKGYSLAKIEDSVISIHRVVQEVIRVRIASTPTGFWGRFSKCLRKNSLEKEADFLRKLIKAITKTDTNLRKCDMPHVLSVWRHASNFDKLTRIIGSFPYRVMNKLADLSLYREMLHFAILNHKQLKTVLGEDHLETLRMESQVAYALWGNWKYKEALDTYKRVYETQKLIVGVIDPATLITAHQMAFCLGRVGRYDDALELYRSVLESQKKVTGQTDTKETVRTKNGMANVLMKHKDKQKEAMAILEEVLEWQKKKLGEEDPETLETKQDIGIFMFKQGQLKETKEIFEEVLTSRQTELGNNHPDTLDTKSLLADLVYELGDSDKSLEMMKEVLASEEKLLGKNHPDIISTKNSLALKLFELGEKDKAMDMLNLNDDSGRPATVQNRVWRLWPPNVIVYGPLVPV